MPGGTKTGVRSISFSRGLVGSNSPAKRSTTIEVKDRRIGSTAHRRNDKSDAM